MWNNFPPVNSAGIRTHDLWNTSAFPLLLDQGFLNLFFQAIRWLDAFKAIIKPIESLIHF